MDHVLWSRKGALLFPFKAMKYDYLHHYDGEDRKMSRDVTGNFPVHIYQSVLLFRTVWIHDPAPSDNGQVSERMQ